MLVSAHFEYPAAIYLLKAKSRNIRIRCEIYSKLTIKIPYVVMVSFLLNLNITHTLFSYFYC